MNFTNKNTTKPFYTSIFFVSLGRFVAGSMEFSTAKNFNHGVTKKVEVHQRRFMDESNRIESINPTVSPNLRAGMAIQSRKRGTFFDWNNEEYSLVQDPQEPYDIESRVKRRNRSNFFRGFTTHKVSG